MLRRAEERLEAGCGSGKPSYLRAAEAGRKLMAAVGGLDVEIAVEEDPVGRVGYERMHLLDVSRSERRQLLIRRS